MQNKNSRENATNPPLREISNNKPQQVKGLKRQQSRPSLGHGTPRRVAPLHPRKPKESLKSCRSPGSSTTKRSSDVESSPISQLNIRKIRDSRHQTTAAKTKPCEKSAQKRNTDKKDYTASTLEVNDALPHDTDIFTSGPTITGDRVSPDVPAAVTGRRSSLIRRESRSSSDGKKKVFSRVMGTLHEMTRTPGNSRDHHSSGSLRRMLSGKDSGSAVNTSSFNINIYSDASPVPGSGSGSGSSGIPENSKRSFSSPFCTSLH